MAGHFAEVWSVCQNMNITLLQSVPDDGDILYAVWYT